MLSKCLIDKNKSQQYLKNLIILFFFKYTFKSFFFLKMQNFKNPKPTSSACFIIIFSLDFFSLLSYIKLFKVSLFLNTNISCSQLWFSVLCPSSYKRLYLWSDYYTKNMWWLVNFINDKYFKLFYFLFYFLVRIWIQCFCSNINS